MFNMKVLLVICVFLAITNHVCSRPNKDKDDYDDADVLNDDEGGLYTGDDEDDDIDDDDDDENDSPPQFISKSLTIDAKIGSSVDFPCLTEDADAYSIMWKKDEVMLYQDSIQVGQKDPRYRRYENQTLHVDEVKEEDAGFFTCEISTSPELTILKHKLVVLSPPKIISAKTRNGKTELKLGDMLELICIAEGNPKPKISWSKDGTRISHNADNENSAVVTLLNVGKNDAGVYVCIADNNITVNTEPVMEHVKIVVNQPPSIKIEILMAGADEITLKCKVHAVPKADVMWIRNDEILKNTDRIKLIDDPKHNEHSVMITKLSKVDFGQYTCRAKNHLGDVEKPTSFTGKPLLATYNSHRFNENNDLEITWTVASMAPITKYNLQYRLKRQGGTWKTEIPEVEFTPGYLHTVNHVLKTLERGVYEVRIRSENKYGWSDYSHPVIAVEGNRDEPYPITEFEKEPIKSSEINKEPTTSGSSYLVISQLLVIVLSFSSIFL